MNWFQKIVNKTIEGLGYERKYITAGDFLSLGGNSARLPDPSSRDYYGYLRAYADKAWVYSCVSIIADTASSAPFVLKNRNGETIDKHPVLTLLDKPNNFMTGRALRQWIIGALELTGNAYMLKDAKRGKRAGELFPLLSHLVEIIPSGNAQNPVEGYRYRAGGKTAVYAPEDIIHFKYYNPFDFFYGLSPLAAARTCADTLTAAEAYNRAFFDNSAQISGILSTETKLDPATRSRIMKAWLERHRGEGKAHKVALLEGGLKWQDTGINQKDMEFIAGMKINRETLLAIFHIPPALVGIFDHAPQFNTREQQRIFWQICIIPKLSYILETLTEFLIPDFDANSGLYFEADTSSISFLREDQTGISQCAKTYHEIGFTKEEIIDALGLPFAKTARKGNSKS